MIIVIIVTAVVACSSICLHGTTFHRIRALREQVTRIKDNEHMRRRLMQVEVEVETLLKIPVQFLPYC